MKRKIVKKQNPNIYAEVNLKTIQKLNSSISDNGRIKRQLITRLGII